VLSPKRSDVFVPSLNPGLPGNGSSPYSLRSLIVGWGDLKGKGEVKKTSELELLLA